QTKEPEMLAVSRPVEPEPVQVLELPIPQPPALLSSTIKARSDLAILQDDFFGIRRKPTPRDDPGWSKESIDSFLARLRSKPAAEFRTRPGDEAMAEDALIKACRLFLDGDFKEA